MENQTNIANTCVLPGRVHVCFNGGEPTSLEQLIDFYNKNFSDMLHMKFFSPRFVTNIDANGGIVSVTLPDIDEQIHDIEIVLRNLRTLKALAEEANLR